MDLEFFGKKLLFLVETLRVAKSRTTTNQKTPLWGIELIYSIRIYLRRNGEIRVRTWENWPYGSVKVLCTPLREVKNHEEFQDAAWGTLFLIFKKNISPKEWRNSRPNVRNSSTKLFRVLGTPEREVENDDEFRDANLGKCFLLPWENVSSRILLANWPLWRN